MTLKEFMESFYPNYVNKKVSGGVKGCPTDFAPLAGHFDFVSCDNEKTYGDCQSCWNQPYIETADTTEPPEETDNVNHPKHYTGGIECIDAMLQTQGIEAVKGFCTCNALKYIWRQGNKNGVEDIKKAIWYLNKYIELVKGENEK